MQLKIVLFLVISITVLDSPSSGQLWPWQTTQGALPTPSTHVDGSDGGVISLNYAFDVNNLIPNGIRNWISGGLGTIQNDILSVLGSVGGTNIDTLKMLNTIMSTIDQFGQTHGANADTLDAQIKALAQQVMELNAAQLQRSYSAAVQSNSSLASSVQALSQNIVTQLRYLESIVSPTLPCASQAYGVLAEAARSGAQNAVDCLNQCYQNTLRNTNFSLNNAQNYARYYKPNVYRAVQECNENSGVSLLISNVTKSSACWAKAALNMKSETINMLYLITDSVSWSTLYTASLQKSLAQCIFGAFDVFSTNTVNAGIQKLFSCSGAWNSYYNSTQSIANKK